MARKNNAKNETVSASEFHKVGCLFEITGAHWTADDTCCFFSLLLHTANGDIQLHGMKLRYDNDGKPMLCCASYKGTNGRWFSHYYLQLAPEMAAEIVKQLEDM